MALKKAELARRRGSGKLLVRLEGEFAHRHSFGQVGRETAFSLLGRPEVDLRLLLHGPMEFRLENDARTKTLLPYLESSAEEDVDVHIRVYWPPDYEPPRSGRWVLAQPWEFGNLPESWVEAFRDKVDEVWCSTRYVRDAFERAGFPPERISIVPYGIDPDVFRPDLEPLSLPTHKCFKFLYVGGTLERKGADLLLEAYLSAFSVNDDVVLIVKDMGTKTFYRNQTLGDEFLKASKDRTRPEIIYMDHHLSELELTRLYNACDAFVVPYRGEGFCLPALEAMACGLHVIVTGGGATDDFLNGSCGSRIPSDRVESQSILKDGTKCVAPLFYMQPDVHELVRLMRWAYEHPQAGKQLGRAASQRARSEWTWDHAGSIIVERLRKLALQPIRRFCAEEVKEEPESGDGTSTERQPVVPEPDEHSLNALEHSLMRGELDKVLKPLEDLFQREKLHPKARPTLLLATKCLSSETNFALRGISTDEKDRLLGLAHAALKRIVEPERKGIESARPKVSLTMIVRNEERNISDCLQCVRSLVDEMVVVDTGSEDRTKVMASALGAKVFDFPWVDSFARARNEALSHATGDWIFWLDADDRVNPENQAKLKDVFESLPRDQILAYSMKVECVAEPGSSPTVVDHVRLFPRHSGLRWEYRVHENILPAINRLGGEVSWSDVVIHHVGYLDGGLREGKRLRDQRLLQMNIVECPEDPFVHFNLGHSLIDGGDLERAAYHLRESISRSEPHYSQVKKAYALLAQVEWNRGDVEGALRVLEEGRVHHAENAELLYFSGVYLHDLGRLDESAKCFERILGTKSWPKEFGSFDVGILGHKSQHRLAKVCVEMGRLRQAEDLLLDVRRTQPGYIFCLLDLTELWIRSGREVEARGLIAEIRGKGLLVDAHFLEGLLASKREDYQVAREAFEKTIELEPCHAGALKGLVEVSHRLGLEKRAEEALRLRARLLPASILAQHELAAFLWDCGRREDSLREVNRALAIEPRHRLSMDLKSRILASTNGAEAHQLPESPRPSPPQKAKQIRQP